ncbi:MAG TPA: urea ABC transporter ATP-binding subunit UrtE [Conexibacter sp.]|nr:urea ABC transporter ATP-binding subunit UrtE [Conexibacter sp.]
MSAATAAPVAATTDGLREDDLLRVEAVDGGHGSTAVLFGVSLGVPRNGLCCLMGRNGVGKSTVLQTVVGLLKARRGRVLFDGEDITKLRPYDRARAGIAFVPQGRDCFPQLTVMENMRVVQEARRDLPRSGIDDALDLFPRLKELLDRPAGFLSGGQMQQLAIARALVTQPKLLLLDEPTEGIQPSIILEIEDAIAELKRTAGLSILLVEQYVDFALRLAERYAVMDGGRVVDAGDTAGLEDGHVRRLLAV